MKHIKLLLIIFISFSNIGHSVAQPTYNSIIKNYSGINSNQDLTCEYMNRYIVSYSHSSITSTQHFFTVQDMQASTPVIKRFSLNIGSEFGNSFTPTITYRLNDMKVSTNGICYFCGTRITEYYSSPFTIENVGFIGMFSIAKVLNGSDTCTILHINGTGALTRIEPRGSYEQVFAVGVSDGYSVDPYNNTPASFLVGLESNSQNTEWYYDIVMPIHYTEQFTDVISCGGIIVSSKYMDDNYHIGLRQTKNGPLRDNYYLGLLSYCNYYDMHTAVNSAGVAVACRKYKDPILMVTKSGPTTMAHSCYNVANGIAAYFLYTVTPGDAQIFKARYTPSTDYISLLDLSVRYGSHVPLFLAKDNTGTQSIISQTNWLSSGSFYPYLDITIDETVSNCRSLESFSSASTTEYLYINGINTSDQPMYLAEKFSHIGQFPSCMPSGNLKYFFDLQTPSFSRILAPLECLYAHVLIEDPIRQAIVSTSITAYTTCNN